MEWRTWHEKQLAAQPSLFVGGVGCHSGMLSQRQLPGTMAIGLVDDV